MRAIQDIIRRPLLTEKGMDLQERHGIYAFEVSPFAYKVEIKAAIEELFGVEVSGVRTAVVRGKSKRFGRTFGKRSNWKKAYVSLKGDAQLDLLNPIQ